MSTRNIRKLTGGNVLPPPDDDEEDDYVPYARKKSSENVYEGLIASSHSESEGKNVSSDESHNAEDVRPNGDKKKKKKKRKQKKQKQRVRRDTDDIELDEIERSLREVNELLGSPVPIMGDDARQASGPRINLMAINNKNLNHSYEEYRLFGPNDEEDAARRRGRHPHLERIMKRGLIVQGENFDNFAREGLSMSIHRKNGLSYFVFDHSSEYQNKHRLFIEIILRSKNSTPLHLENVLQVSHPEELIEMGDIMFRIEDSSKGRKFIEKAIAYLQYTSHPLFRLNDPTVRLEYKYVENRMFHVAVLKYLHLLTNTMCHRTALELAKLLLNLDPSDPLGVVFIIDTLALRAREHQWLIDIVNLWKEEREAHFLVNIQYSYAMAKYHLTKKQEGDMTEANELLQTAILNFPTVVLKLLEFTKIKEPQIAAHSLFQTAESSTSVSLQFLILMYTKFSSGKWREPGVLDWLISNAKELMDKFDNDPAVQERAVIAAVQRKSLFVMWPDELVRHLVIIKPIINLILEIPLPNLGNDGVACNPLPVPLRNGIDRYQYMYKTLAPEDLSMSRTLLGGFFLMMAPGLYPAGSIEADPDDIVSQAELRNDRIAAERHRQRMRERAQREQNEGGNINLSLYDELREAVANNAIFVLPHLSDYSDDDYDMY